MRTVACPELGLDTGALADKEGEGRVAGLDVTIVLLHELPAGDQIASGPNQKQQNRTGRVEGRSEVCTGRRRWRGRTGRRGRGSPLRSETGSPAMPSPPPPLDSRRRLLPLGCARGKWRPRGGTGSLQSGDLGSLDRHRIHAVRSPIGGHRGENVSGVHTHPSYSMVCSHIVIRRKPMRKVPTKYE